MDRIPTQNYRRFLQRNTDGNVPSIVQVIIPQYLLIPSEYPHSQGLTYLNTVVLRITPT
jgi:hypothetical protein